MSALPVTRRAVDVFDHPRLFMVPLARPRARSAAAKTHQPQVIRTGRARVAPTDRHKGGLRRYCLGCAPETELVAWAAFGRGSTHSIRWPTTEPATGTTICLNCGASGVLLAPNRDLRRGLVGPETGWPRQASPPLPRPPTQTIWFPKPRPRTKECLRSGSRDLRAEAARPRHARAVPR